MQLNGLKTKISKKRFYATSNILASLKGGRGNCLMITVSIMPLTFLSESRR